MGTEMLTVFVSPTDVHGNLALTIQSIARGAELAVSGGMISSWNITSSVVDSREAQEAALLCANAGGRFVESHNAETMMASHRSMVECTNGEWVLVVDAGAVVSPASLRTLLTAVQLGGGLVEARTVPIQHDQSTDPAGTAAWLTFHCCALERLSFMQILDEVAHGSYDDTLWHSDYSEAARRLGLKLRMDGRASVFVDRGTRTLPLTGVLIA